MQRRTGQRRGFVLLLSPWLLLGCKDKEPARGETRATPSASVSVCKDGGGTARYDEPLFERVVAGYCIDPHGETRAYGAGAPEPLEEICNQLFEGECTSYVDAGLERVTTLRYVDDRGEAGSVHATLFRFGRRAQAFAFFTGRVLGAADPAELARKPLDAGASAALGSTVVDVWRGSHVLELTYTSESESPDQIAASSGRVLPELARALGEKIPGSKAPLDEVRLLPTQNRLPLGVSYELERLLGVSGAGAGAIGHYVDGDERYRVLAALRDDEQTALDLRETLARAGSFRPLKKEDAIEVRFPAVATVPGQRWVFAQRGNALVGVGDERFGTREPPGDLDKELERKLRKLRKMISDDKLPPPKRKKNPTG